MNWFVGKLATLAVIVLFAGGQGYACFQSTVPSVQLRSRVLAGTVSLNGKPIDGALLSLHKFLGPYSVEPGHLDAHVLGEAKTEPDGKFSFGEIGVGKYVIVMSKPSNELTDVELVAPKGDDRDTVAMEFFADFCQTAAAVSAKGIRLAPMLAPKFPDRQ
jgi:hypothetical protein